MGHKARKAFKQLTITIPISKKAWAFAIRYCVLAGAVLIGVVIVRTFHELIPAMAIARAVELAGEAGADALMEG